MDWEFAALFALFLAASAAAGATGSLFPPGEWYRQLAKPRWTPPNWLFPLAWSALYLASSLAAARVAGLPGSGLALAFWALQVALNTLWSPVFFGLRRMRAALVVLAGLWLAVAGMAVSFLALDTLAGALVLPYLVWVTVAGALNLAVVRLNPAPDPAGA